MAGLLKPVAHKGDTVASGSRPAAQGESVFLAGVGDGECSPRSALRSSPLLERPDRALVELSLKGDTDAYGELVARHQHAVRLLAKGIVKDHQHAEDLAQEAFIRGFHSLADLKEPEKFGGWVATILRRAALDYLRLAKNPVSLEVLQEEGFEPRHPAPEQAPVLIETEEDNARVLEALRNLREDYREIIVLKHVENLSYKELASRLNMSVSAVGEKLSRVRALLKRRLDKRPVTPHP